MINIYYRYSKLDKRHEYSVTDTNGQTIFLTWIFFFLGNSKLLKIKDRILLFPFIGYGHEKIIKSYTYKYGAKQIASWIAVLIVNHYNKQVKKLKNKKS